MGVKEITGNIFTSNCKVVVNTVNCVGVMGAGLALECRLRWPQMFKEYQSLCAAGRMEIGKLWLYEADTRWVLCFPTKKHWRHPSKTDYLEKGLAHFVETYEGLNVESVAFPLLGADRGGIPRKTCLEIMRRHLQKVDAEIEIYSYDNQAKDDLFDSFSSWFKKRTLREIAAASGIQVNAVEKVSVALKREDICQLGQLGGVRGIGVKTLEKLFSAAVRHDGESSCQSGQLTLDYGPNEST